MDHQSSRLLAWDVIGRVRKAGYGLGLGHGHGYDHGLLCHGPDRHDNRHDRDGYVRREKKGVGVSGDVPVVGGG